MPVNILVEEFVEKLKTYVFCLDNREEYEYRTRNQLEISFMYKRDGSTIVSLKYVGSVVEQLVISDQELQELLLLLKEQFMLKQNGRIGTDIVISHSPILQLDHHEVQSVLLERGSVGEFRPYDMTIFFKCTDPTTLNQPFY